MDSNREYTVIDSPFLRAKKVACLTLDLEQDYAGLLDNPSYEGLEHILEFITYFKKLDIPLTCFVQGSLFESHPNSIGLLSSLDIEFELHSYSHPNPRYNNAAKEIARSSEAYTTFFGKEPLGYRFPLCVIGKQDYEILANSGFKFDSSILPSLRPGAFNNLRYPTQPYLMNKPKLLEFPLGVFSNTLRIPVTLSYIKLLGRPYICLLKTFALSNLIVFNFHLHDLFTLNTLSRIPFSKLSPVYCVIYRRIYKTRKDGIVLLGEMIMMLREKGYSFQKLEDIYKLLID